MTFKILDCTLRDGGYYTKWDFSDQTVHKYLTAMSALPIDMIELGYRHPPLPGYAGQYFYLTPGVLSQLRKFLRPGQQVACMMDVKSCASQQAEKLLQGCQGLIDMIRLAVDPDKLEQALDLLDVVKQAGFKASMNLMYLSTRTDLEQTLEAISARGVKPDCVSLVDSYGGCFPEEVENAVRLAKAVLPGTVETGFHAHDNLSLAFANAIAAIRAGADWIDATLLGMGRGAGNLKTELIVAYSEKAGHAAIVPDFMAAMPALYEFQDLKDHYRWGTQLPYIVSGMNNIPQKDVMDWLSLQRYSPSLITHKLKGTGQPKISKDLKPLTEYTAALQDDLGPVIIIGGGPSLKLHQGAIKDFAQSTNALLIHVSVKNADLFSVCDNTQWLCLVGDEKSKLPQSRIQIAAQHFSAFICDMSEGHDSTHAPFMDQTYFTQSFKSQTASAADPLCGVTPLGLALAAAMAIDQKRPIYLAGFDGFDNASIPAARQIHAETQGVLNAFREKHAARELLSLLDTSYDVPAQSVYSFL